MTSIYTSFMCADIVKQGDEIISVGQLNQQAKKLLEEFGEGIIALSGCPNSQLSQAIVANDFTQAKNIAEWHNNVFDDFYLELQDHRFVDNLESINKGLINLNKDLNLPLGVPQYFLF